MTLWLSNVAAYSVQLAVLVGAGLAAVAVLRVHTPRVALRFWQALFASTVLWPACQLWMHSASSSGVLAVGLFGSASASTTAGMRAGIAAWNPGLTMLVIGVLGAGAVVRLVWIGVGLIRLRSIRAGAEPAHALSSIAAPLQKELGVAAEICLSDAVDSPATIGARRPMVLLPHRVCGLPRAVQEAVLWHELVHVRRRDWTPALVEELWCAILWFHPAARALVSRLSLARETLVDEVTIARTRDRRAYASALLEFSTPRTRLVGAPALIGRRHLERRIALLAQEVSMSRPSLALRLLIAAGVVAVATVATTSRVPVSATLLAQAERPFKPGQDAGVTLPKVIKEVKPDYTAEALQAKIQGSVWLQVVVLANGDVGDVTLTKSLDKQYGLDQQAIDAVRQWKFEPGTKAGKPVPVQVTIEMTFTLKK